ncbi:hypothetical protein OROGR_001593 [Orobanche gracilis]
MHNSHTHTRKKIPFFSNTTHPASRPACQKKHGMWFLLPIDPIRYMAPQTGQMSSEFTKPGKAAMMSGKKTKLLVEAKKELDQSIHMVKAHAARREDPSLTVPNIKVKVSQQQKEDNRMEE